MYLDANATSPLAPAVWAAMEPWMLRDFYNASSPYYGGKRARHAIDDARAQVATLIGAREDEIVFTSGGTEAVNTALRSLHALCPDGDVLTSQVEHSAVLRTADSLERTTRHCRVLADGLLDMGHFEELCAGAAFVSLMWANNETGVMFDIAEAAAIAKKHGLPFFTDAIQAAGKIPIDVSDHDIELLALSAHKFHGPKGIGALYVKRGTAFVPMLHGGGQEHGRRSGTENVAAIVGMGVAASLACEHLCDSSLATLRHAFESRVMATVQGVTRNGAVGQRLPNTSHLSFADCEAAGLLILLDDLGVACSAGSACMSGKQQPSHVQKAMGLSDAVAKSSLRFSVSHFNTMEEMEKAAACVARAVAKLRSVQSPGVGPVTVYQR
jgi:cysteine desulfurase